MEYLTTKEVAALYGGSIKFKWLDVYGDNWLDKEGVVNAALIKEVEQGSIKECYK
jgi:hypothetical protein